MNKPNSLITALAMTASLAACERSSENTQIADQEAPQVTSFGTRSDCPILQLTGEGSANVQFQSPSTAFEETLVADHDPISLCGLQNNETVSFHIDEIKGEIQLSIFSIEGTCILIDPEDGIPGDTNRFGYQLGHLDSFEVDLTANCEE